MTHTYTIEITRSNDKTSWNGKLLEDGKEIQETSSATLIAVVNSLEFTLNERSSE